MYEGASKQTLDLPRRDRPPPVLKFLYPPHVLYQAEVKYMNANQLCMYYIQNGSEIVSPV